MLQTISYLEGVWKVGGDIALPTIPNYKFFSTLLNQLLEKKRRNGISPLGLLPLLKACVTGDVEFQQRWSSNVHGSLAQFGILLAMLIFYVHFACYILQVQIALVFLLFFYSYLVSSFALYLLALKYGYRYYLASYDAWLRWVFTLRLTSGQGLPKEGQEYGPLPGTRRGEHFRFWQQFLRQSLDLTRREGHPLQGKLDYLLDEITRQRSQALAQFLKKMELLRFFISILVFLSSYFAFVYWLLTSMWPASL